MKKEMLAFMLVVSTLLVSGCSTKNCVDGDCALGGVLKLEPLETVGHKTRITPILGTKQNDAKIVRDFGVTLKVTIFPYKDKDDNLIGGQDIYVVAKTPEWLAGEKIPAKRAKGITSLSGKSFPVTLRPEELNHASEVDEKSLIDFQNKMNNIEKNPQLAGTKLDSTGNDEKILEFLKSRRK